MIHQIFYLHAIGLNHHVTEYPLAKTGGYPRISPAIVLSTTISLCHMVTIEEEGKYLVFFFYQAVPGNTQKKTSQAANSKLFVNIFFLHSPKYLKDNKYNILRKNILVYLSLDIICSLKLAVFLELCSCKTICIWNR